MRRIVIIPTLAALCLALGNPQWACADPITTCTTNSVNLARFGPCEFQGTVFSDFKATLGGVDVTASDFLGATSFIDADPGEVATTPTLVIPQPLLPGISPSNPLTISFHAAALDPARALSGATEVIHPFSDFDGLLSSEFRAGSFSATARLGTGLDGTALPRQTFVSFGRQSALDVITTLTADAPLGGGFGFAFDLAPASPVPEPSTFLLLAGGGLVAVRRRLQRV